MFPYGLPSRLLVLPFLFVCANMTNDWTND